MNVGTFGAVAGNRSDTTPAVRAALRSIGDEPKRRLIFPTGRYDFWPDRAEEHYLFVSNNDESLKRIAFPLFHLNDIEIDGQDSEFIFHGDITPFALRNARNIRLSNFTVDWDRTFHNEALVLDSGEGYADLQIDPRFPYQIEYDRLVFLGERGERQSIGNALEFDPIRRETAYKAHDNYRVRHAHAATELEPGRVRFHAQFSTRPTPGNVLCLANNHRLVPAITIGDSRDIEIRGVNLHHCGGMGIIAQRTEEIRVANVRVTPRPDSGRIISLTADAAHFVNCRGRIEMTGCLFENQLDDAVNVHGIYGRIAARRSDYELEYEIIHPQQLGVDLTQPEDTVEIVRGTTLATCFEGRVSAVDRLNKTFTRLTFHERLPHDVTSGDALQSLGWQPDLTIRGCASRGNRARGFLVTTRGKALIENNTFHVPGAAILVEGDANHWYESGSVGNLTIRNNHFDNNNYGVWGRAAIEINPQILPQYRPGNVYHRNIRIENNTFDAFDPRLVRAHCVSGLTVKNNKIRANDAYPTPPGEHEAFDITKCEDVTIAGNQTEAKNEHAA